MVGAFCLQKATVIEKSSGPDRRNKMERKPTEDSAEFVIEVDDIVLPTTHPHLPQTSPGGGPYPPSPFKNRLIPAGLPAPDDETLV